VGSGGQSVSHGAFLSDELREICARAYDVFDVPVPDTAGVCTACCMSPEDERAIRATPVREVPLRLVQEWLYAAYAPDIGRPHLVWIFPRIMELLAQGQDVSWIGNQVAFARCEQGGSMRDWPKARRDVFGEFAAAYVDARLDWPGPGLDEMFCILGASGMDPAPIIARLDAVPLPRLARAMLADWNGVFPDLGSDAFWKKGPFLDAVRDWFCDGRLGDRLMQYGMDCPDDEIEVIWAAAEAVVRR